MYAHSFSWRNMPWRTIFTVFTNQWTEERLLWTGQKNTSKDNDLKFTVFVEIIIKL